MDVLESESKSNKVAREELTKIKRKRSDRQLLKLDTCERKRNGATNKYRWPSDDLFFPFFRLHQLFSIFSFALRIT